MRARLTADHRPYWNYQVIPLTKDTVVTGDLARYLISTGGPVAAEDDDAKELIDVTAEEAQGLGHREGDIGRPLPDTIGDQPPAGSEQDVLDWVGHDQERAARAIGAEEDSAEPREELLERLRQIHHPGPGDAYPEGGSAEEVKAWVGEDAERARTALEAEEARDKPRAGLSAHLKKLG
ncbi:hypothetical protein OOK06_36560 [Streptomyces sp. NBC_00340]|uniref:hypothetical protein n=1 Tax=Streptomyces sp. NBC_00340 TaxID=2975716 RepID=UPI00224D1BF3|nr:hypothetical protein [Streptomyces sp. NBC_00340]MCX5137583.1 hypothetical protein [Streptomyces sp. NBC_00340]